MYVLLCLKVQMMIWVLNGICLNISVMFVCECAGRLLSWN